MIRKRKEIEVQIKYAKTQLDSIITGALEREEADEETIKMINNEIVELRSEVCFEDTFEGKIKDIEQTSFKTIDVILEKLSEITGKSYKRYNIFQSDFGQPVHTFKGHPSKMYIGRKKL